VAQVGESQLVSDGAGMRLELSTADLQHLNNPAEEGVYLRRNWTSDSGREIRFVAYVEIDKKKDKHKHPSRPETKTGEIQPSASKIEQTRECLVIIDESGSGHSSPRENTP